MILDLKIDCECVGDVDGFGGRDCNGKIDQGCIEAGESGGFCEYMCVSNILRYEEMKK